jgi:hypothetical protein
MKLFFLGVLAAVPAFANLHLAPPDFDTARGRAVFVDFKAATYDVTYDLKKRETRVSSRITFEAKAAGHPLFDLIPAPRNARLNGRPVAIREAAAPNGQLLREVGAPVAPGTHTLELTNTFSENVRYRRLSRGVSSAFWIRDLKYRKFLEQYVPSNFEFDQYPVTMNVTFAGVAEARQDIYANGAVTPTSPNSFRITFPAWYTVSAHYFHTTPKGQKKRLDFNYRSVDGRDIPVTVYTAWWSRPQKFRREAEKLFAELEADYGPWGHDAFVAYETLPGTGGMEHAGATQTSLAALDHEMLHSYFAKGVFPANGNAGWIDEAIASWRDHGYQRKPLPDYAGSDLGLGSPYQRNTDSRAYALGREFMAYLDYRLQEVGGLKAFLRAYFQTYKHTVITQEHFKNNLEFFSGLDLTEDFETYVWGANETTIVVDPSPHHVPLSRAELMKLL